MDSSGAEPKTGQALQWIVLSILVIVWGSTFAVIKIGVETIDPAWLVTGRLWSGALFLGCWMAGEAVLRRMKRHRQGDAHLNVESSAPPKIRWGEALVWYGLIGVVFTALPFVLFAFAATSVSSAVLAICNGGTPFFTAILAHYLVATEKLTARRVIGVGMGFAGLVILVAPEMRDGMNARVIGLVLAIAGAALYAGTNVATRRAPVLSPVLSSFLMMATGAVAMAIAAPLLAPFPTQASAASLAAMIALGVLPTGMAYILYVWLIRQAGTVFTSFTTYLSPLWATGIGVLFLDETLQVTMLAALGLIFAGVAIANRAPRRKHDAA